MTNAAIQSDLASANESLTAAQQLSRLQQLLPQSRYLPQLLAGSALMPVLSDFARSSISALGIWKNDFRSLFQHSPSQNYQRWNQALFSETADAQSEQARSQDAAQLVRRLQQTHPELLQHALQNHLGRQIGLSEIENSLRRNSLLFATSSSDRLCLLSNFVASMVSGYASALLSRGPFSFYALGLSAFVGALNGATQSFVQLSLQVGNLNPQQLHTMRGQLLWQFVRGLGIGAGSGVAEYAVGRVFHRLHFNNPATKIMGSLAAFSLGDVGGEILSTQLLSQLGIALKLEEENLLEAGGVYGFTVNAIDELGGGMTHRISPVNLLNLGAAGALLTQAEASQSLSTLFQKQSTQLVALGSASLLFSPESDTHHLLPSMAMGMVLSRASHDTSIATASTGIEKAMWTRVQADWMILKKRYEHLPELAQHFEEIKQAKDYKSINAQTLERNFQNYAGQATVHTQQRLFFALCDYRAKLLQLHRKSKIHHKVLKNFIAELWPILEKLAEKAFIKKQVIRAFRYPTIDWKCKHDELRNWFENYFFLQGASLEPLESKWKNSLKEIFREGNFSIEILMCFALKTQHAQFSSDSDLQEKLFQLVETLLAENPVNTQKLLRQIQKTIPLSVEEKQAVFDFCKRKTEASEKIKRDIAFIKNFFDAENDFLNLLNSFLKKIQTVNTQERIDEILNEHELLVKGLFQRQLRGEAQELIQNRFNHLSEKLENLPVLKRDAVDLDPKAHYSSAKRIGALLLDMKERANEIELSQVEEFLDYLEVLLEALKEVSFRDINQHPRYIQLQFILDSYLHTTKLHVVDVFSTWLQNVVSESQELPISTEVHRGIEAMHPKCLEFAALLGISESDEHYLAHSEALAKYLEEKLKLNTQELILLLQRLKKLTWAFGNDTTAKLEICLRSAWLAQSSLEKQQAQAALLSILEEFKKSNNAFDIQKIILAKLQSFNALDVFLELPLDVKTCDFISRQNARPVRLISPPDKLPYGTIGDLELGSVDIPNLANFFYSIPLSEIKKNESKMSAKDFEFKVRVYQNRLAQERKLVQFSEGETASHDNPAFQLLNNEREKIKNSLQSLWYQDSQGDWRILFESAKLAHGSQIAFAEREYQLKLEANQQVYLQALVRDEFKTKAYHRRGRQVQIPEKLDSRLLRLNPDAYAAIEQNTVRGNFKLEIKAPPNENISQQAVYQEAANRLASLFYWALDHQLNADEILDLLHRDLLHYNLEFAKNSVCFAVRLSENGRTLESGNWESPSSTEGLGFYFKPVLRT